MSTFLNLTDAQKTQAKAVLQGAHENAKQFDVDGEGMLQNSLWAPRLAAGLLGVFGLLALGLASIGIYGVMAYTVSQRTREIGIRIALGAERADVLGMVVRQGMLLVCAGVAVGLLGALGVTRFAASVMFGVSPTEPVTFAAVTVLLLTTALLACYIPSRRAARVDPVVALRYE